MIKLNTIEDLNKYLENQSTEKALFCELSVDFNIMKYFTHQEPLRNVNSLLDFLQNSNDIPSKRIYMDYGDDTPFNNDTQIYINNSLIKNGSKIGLYEANQFNLSRIIYENVQYQYDPRGFLSTIGCFNENNLSYNIIILDVNGKSVLEMTGNSIKYKSKLMNKKDALEMIINEYFEHQRH